MAKGEIRKFIDMNFRHFNAAALVDAAKAYGEHMKKAATCSLPWEGR